MSLVRETPSAPDDVRPRRYVLPRRATPYPDESLVGLLMRTAEIYRFRDPRRLLKRIHAPDSLSLWTLCQEDPDGRLGTAMATLLGLDAGDYRRVSMWTGEDTTLRILDTRVWRDLARNSVRAVCPDCLREATYHRAIWLVDALPVCAVHGTSLVDRCPKPGCGRQLTWGGMGVHRCGNRGCAFDLRRAESARAEPETLGGVVTLHRLLHEADDSGSPLGMPRGEALRMAFALGQVAFGHTRGTRPNGYIERHRQELPQILEAGWRALEDWPNGFHALLDRLVARAAGQGRRGGLQRNFGKLSKWVYEWAREPWGGPIGVAFAEFVGGQPHLAVSGHTLRRYAPGTDLRHVHVSLGDAQKLLGVSPVTMMTIAERRNMFVRRPDGSGTPALLRADGVRELVDELADFMLPKEVRATLGVGYRLLRQLEAAGLVQQVPEADRVMETRPYRRSDVEAFAKACTGRARRIGKQAAEEASLSRITRMAAPGRDVPDICRALLEGRLQAVATVTGERGLAALRFQMEDVTRALPAAVETMPIVEAAERLDVHYRHLHIWARKGLLETVASDRPGERGLRVTEEGLARFRETYASGRDLKTLFSQEGNHWLSRHLAFQGVLPVSGKGVDEGDLTVFRRADLTPDVIRAVRDVQARPPGTGQDKHRAAFAKAERAAEAVAAAWGARFTRTNNCFTDAGTGRTLQVVSGRRPDLTGVFRFKLNPASLRRLQARGNSWVALVPAQGDVFLLVPLDAVPWRGGGKDNAYVTASFDASGRPVKPPNGAEEVRLADPP